MSVVIPFSESSQIRMKLGLTAGQKLVFTNGCFDILHAGHVRYLEAARQLGDALVVGLNGDESVRTLKGENRPINCEGDRAEVLAGLSSVSAVVIFPDVRATALIEKLRPDVYVKGGDYTVESLDAGERTVLQAIGCEMAFVPMVPGRSTTSTLAKMRVSAK